MILEIITVLSVMTMNSLVLAVAETRDQTTRDREQVRIKEEERLRQVELEKKRKEALAVKQANTDPSYFSNTISRKTKSYNAEEIKETARMIMSSEFGWGEDQFLALDWINSRESRWDPYIKNTSSGACGIPQALPCSKMPDVSIVGQLRWQLNYIKNRYGTPISAKSFWIKKGWY